MATEETVILELRLWDSRRYVVEVQRGGYRWESVTSHRTKASAFVAAEALSEAARETVRVLEVKDF